MTFSWDSRNKASFGHISPHVDKAVETITVSSSGTTGSAVIDSLNGFVNAIFVDGPSMDNAGDTVRVTHKPQGRNGTDSTIWYDTSDTGTWGAYITDEDFGGWDVMSGDEIEVEFNNSQVANADVTVELRGM